MHPFYRGCVLFVILLFNWGFLVFFYGSSLVIEGKTAARNFAKHVPSELFPSLLWTGNQCVVEEGVFQFGVQTISADWIMT